MEMLKASVVYLISILASNVLKLMIPIEFKDYPRNRVYRTLICKGDVNFEITVEQWTMCSCARVSMFSTRTNYYVAHVDVLLGKNKIGDRKYFFPEPVRGFFKRTKLPHAIIALAALDKANLETSKSMEAA